MRSRNKSMSKSKSIKRSKDMPKKSKSMSKDNRKSKQNRMNKEKNLKQSKNKKFKRQEGQDQRQDQGQDIKQDTNKLIEKSKLLSLNSSKQLQTLKDIYQKVLVNPEQNFKHIQTMFALVKVTNLQIVSSALRILADTFINIAPLQAIDTKKIEERTQIKIKKQEYKVIKFEKNLLEQYERYLKMLKQMHLKTQPENFQGDKEVYTEFKKCLLQCVIKCYRALWNFNYSKELNDLMIKFIKFQECRDFLKEMLTDKNIAMIGIKSKIINGIAKFIAKEDKEKNLPNDIVKIINSTYVDTRYLKKDQESLQYRKKQMKKRLYRQEAFEEKKQKEKRAQKGTLEKKKKKKEEKIREKLRVKEEVNKQFAEGEAIISNKQLVSKNSQILQQLFYVYFKILVERINSKLLKDSLDGVLKFVHLINIELTKSLLEHLNTSAVIYRDLWKQQRSSQLLETRLLIIFTGESIINGPLSVFNMDDLQMVTHLYKVMKDINGSIEKQQKKWRLTNQIYRLLCINLQQAFITRRQLSHEIIGSFARQIAIFLASQNGPKLYLLQVLRVLAYRYHKITRMFEQDNEGFGINSFNTNCEDPQCSNAIYTEIISFLKEIKSDYSQNYQHEVSTNVSRLVKQNFQLKDFKIKLQDILHDELQGGFL